MTRWIRLALAISLTLGAGCSLVLDGGDFITTDAAPPPDAVPPTPDVDPSALALDSLDPPELFEGLGAARPVPVVVHGSSIAGSATAVLDGAGFDAEPVALVVSADGKLAAFELTVPVLEDLSDGETRDITVTVSQGAGVERSLPLRVLGLDDLTPAAGTLAVDTLRPRYARIAIDEEITLTGSAPARLVATAELTVAAAIRADGQNATAGGPGAGGPGGCRGGIVEGPGDCLTGGGRAGGAAGGGGGGGHATVGTGGAGNAPGDGGAETGADSLVPLANDGGNGGGGGGNSTVGQGSAGGGGGGVIELRSHGALTIGAGAALSAAGGDGRAGEGGCLVLLEHGGGGGGGSGGAIFVRADGMLTDEGSGARVDVTGGDGGDGGCNQGGAGAVGRVRVDASAAAPLPGFAGTAVFRGPMLAVDTDAVVTESPLITELVGGPNQTYYVEREGGDPRAAVTTQSDRRGDVSVALAPGLNRVCAVVDDTSSLGLEEAVHCIAVAYIPQ